MLNRKIYTVIKDGNRTVGWDYLGDTTVRTVLNNKYFSWKPNTVRVNGTPLNDEDLDACLEEFLVDGVYKVKITMQKPKKKEDGSDENG